MRTLLVTAIALGLAGCGGKPPVEKAKAADSLTTRQRQEAIGESGIPGARGINRALDISDTAAARNQRLDSIGQ